MATSSIFHNIVINDPQKIEAFIAAAEASIASPYARPDGPMQQVTTDPGKLRRILELNKKSREAR